MCSIHTVPGFYMVEHQTQKILNDRKLYPSYSNNKLLVGISKWHAFKHYGYIGIDQSHFYQKTFLFNIIKEIIYTLSIWYTTCCWKHQWFVCMINISLIYQYRTELIWCAICRRDLTLCYSRRHLKDHTLFHLIITCTSFPKHTWCLCY